MSVWDDEMFHRRFGNGCDSDVESAISARRVRTRSRPRTNLDLQQQLSVIHETEGVEGILRVLSAKALVDIGRSASSMGLASKGGGFLNSDNGQLWAVVAIAVAVLVFDGWGSRDAYGRKGGGGYLR
jgi:hypothetical protein